MATIQWRPEVNLLTTPKSYKIRHVPRNTAGYKEMGDDLATEDPHYSSDELQTLAKRMMRWMLRRAINGDQVTLENAVSCRVSVTGSFEGLDIPQAKIRKNLHLRYTASPHAVAELQAECELEGLAAIEKLPTIASVYDTQLKLEDVLSAGGILRLKGSYLKFDEKDTNCGCVLEGTRSGRAVQRVFGMIKNTLVLFVPDIPEQTDPWNNEYTLTITTQYSEHGTLRSATYGRKLRSPLLVQGLSYETGPGILTGSAEQPYVRINSGTGSASEMLRIVAALDLAENLLTLQLAGMEEGGPVGPEVLVTGNGISTLSGFAGSAITDLTVEVLNYAGLLDLVHNGYSARLVDILDIRLS
jgi:hypothetical protein